MAVRVCVRACECVCARVHGRLNSFRACVHVCLCAYAAHRRMYVRCNSTMRFTWPIAGVSSVPGQCNGVPSGSDLT